MKRNCVVYVLLSLSLFSCSEDQVGESSKTSSVRENPQETKDRNSLLEPVRESPQTKTKENHHELKVTDIELLGLNQESYDIVTGKTISSKEKRAEEALKASKTILIFLELFKEAELGEFTLSEISVSGSPIVTKIIGEISIFLGGFNSLELPNIFVRPGANSKESCMALRESIKSISDQKKKEKAWALVQFFPSLLDAFNYNNQLTPGAINRCDWENL